MNTNKTWLAVSGIFGFLGVALGAFGAHGLKDYLTREMLEVYQTGVLYHLLHTAVLLAISNHAVKKLKSASIFFSAGIVLFSFSLYIYTVTGIYQLVFITPVGGLSFLLGWIFVFVSAFRSDTNAV